MNINLDYFINKALSNLNGKIPRLIIPCPYDKNNINAINYCTEIKLIKPILVGKKNLITKAIDDSQSKLIDFELIEADTDEQAANLTMEYLKNKKADILMKGLIDSSLLLKIFLKKEYELRTNKLITHCVLSFNKNYNKYYIITDPAMVIKPDLQQKKQMIENAVFFARALGNEKPYVANLCAKEKVYEKMPDTIDADLLRQMNINGDIKNCVVSGPLQIDLAINEESAKIKNVNDPVAGKADILVCPNIESANIFSKGITYLGGWSFSGLILGAKIPFVLTSRSTNNDDRILSIALACICLNFNE